MHNRVQRLLKLNENSKKIYVLCIQILCEKLLKVRRRDIVFNNRMKNYDEQFIRIRGS